MAILNILRFPDLRLRTKARPVKHVNDNIRRIVDNMFETMYKAPGIGLAATQVNIHLQIIVIDISEDKNEPLCLINPTLLKLAGTTTTEEGCLSVPEYYADVKRAERVVVKALNKEGQFFQLETDEILAVCIQHEIDHLKGKLFTDYLSPLKQSRMRQKLKKMKALALKKRKKKKRSQAHAAK